MTEVKDSIAALKYSEEITTAQKDRIKRSIHKRIYDILGSNPLDLEKYRHTFISRLYSDAKNMEEWVQESKKLVRVIIKGL